MPSHGLPRMDLPTTAMKQTRPYVLLLLFVELSPSRLSVFLPPARRQKLAVLQSTTTKKIRKYKSEREKKINLI